MAATGSRGLPNRSRRREIIDALEGPIAITECAGPVHQCELESICNVGTAWQRINLGIRRALSDITLAQLATWKRGTVPHIDLATSAGYACMSSRENDVNELVERSYRHGFVTDIEADTVPPGLNEDIDPAHLAQEERAASGCSTGG